MLFISRAQRSTAVCVGTFRDAERVRAVEYFRLEEEKAIKVGREAAAVLQEIEESARYRACQDGTR